MPISIKKLIKKALFRDIKNSIYWILLALIFKVCIFVFLLSQKIPYGERWVFFSGSGDMDTYIAPIENFIANGAYVPDFRMPGYGAVYFIIRLFFTKIMSLNILVFAQVLLDAVSVYLLALTVKYIFNKDTLFYLVFYAYSASTYVSIFSVFILTESFSVSGLIISLFFLIRGFKDYKGTYFLFSGLFLGWCIFLRPSLLPIIGLYLIFLVFYFLTGRYNMRARLAKAVILFILPFLVMEGFWLVRNYKMYGLIIPLQKKIYYEEVENDPVLNSLGVFLRAWGGDYTWWNPKSEINWFRYFDDNPNIKGQAEIKIDNIIFPDYIFTSKFTKRDLEDIRKYILLSGDNNIPKAEQDKFRQLSENKLRGYADSLKKEKPYVYYIYSPLRLLKNFLFNSGTYNLFNRAISQLNIFELTFKVLMSCMYVFTVLGGFLGNSLLLFESRLINEKLFFPAISFYIILVFPFGFRACEYRYFAHAYPFMLVGALYLCVYVNDRVLKIRCQQP